MAELVTIYHPEAGTGHVPSTALETYLEIGWTTEPTETSDADASAEPKPRPASKRAATQPEQE